MKRSTASVTGSKQKRTLSLRVTLFLAILCVALVCIVASALLSNLLSNRQIGEFVQQHQSELQPTPTPANPGQSPPPPPPPRPRNINLSFVLAGILGLVLALGLSLVLAGRISRPLSGLTSSTRKIAGGDYSERVDVGGGREVEELGDAFNTLASGLEKNEELRQNMVADIAHELRNPLATLRAQLELLQDGKITYDRETADSLMEDALMLSRIVEDLRQLSLVDAGQLEFELKPVEPPKILGDVFSRFEHEASGKGVKLELDSTPELPEIEADPVRLAQVLGNLVANSIAHTESGDSVHLGAVPSEGAVEFTVTDTGAGLSPEELPHIFDRFYRTDESRARATGGAGLGLSIAKGLVEAQGGRIWAESEGANGTSIHFTIPLHRA